MANEPSRHDLFVGIDVAVARTKRLPVAMLARRGARLSVVPLKDLAHAAALLPPRGRGNAAVVLDPRWRREFAVAAMQYVADVARQIGCVVRGVAIDAPSAPRPAGMSIRRAEQALAVAGVSFIKTPSLDDFQRVVAAARAHLDAGRSPAELPYANQLWMLAGFELFAAAAQRFAGAEVLEAYPYATFETLDAAELLKSSADGLTARLGALARALALPTRELRRALPRAGWGSGHDKLDALSAAWVASLPPRARRVFGEDPADRICAGRASR